MEVDDDFYQLYIFILITEKHHDSAEFISNLQSCKYLNF